MDNPYLPSACQVLETRVETKTEKTIRIAYSGAVQCGQFFEYSLPGVGEAPFSVSYIGDGVIESTIRRIGRVSEAIHGLKARDEVFLRGPYGHGFPLEEFSGRELVLIAGGTGAAPVRAIIKKIEEGRLKVKGLKILFGFRDGDNILFGNDLKRWQSLFTCRVSLDYPPAGWQGLSGFINQHIDKLKPAPQTRVVVVGPPAMIEFVVDELMEQGINARRIWVSLERLMQCGIGKCGRCRIGSKYVCCDGPVFDYESAQGLRD